jgi:uncharacterized damage-inducible protein DinB
MSQATIKDLISQYQHTFRIFYEEIERFSDQQWIQGLDSFLTPVNVSLHIVDCLDFYFWDNAEGEYLWGHRFGGWWELPDDKLPSKSNIRAYAWEIEARIIKQLRSLEDDDLLRQVEVHDGGAPTSMGRLVYALCHTLHHQGELAALAVYHGLPGGSWD